jgi:glycosyltransferase involved in cell wall biosynthesis
MDALDALAVPFVTITLNREDELFEEMCRQGGRFTLRQRIATQRLAHFERAVYCRSAHVIAIGEPDLPKCIRPELSTCITPYLDTKGPNRWRFTRSRTIFFVGNIGHHPNRIAVRFMEAIAPLVARMQPALSIKIVGADHALSPNPSPNISYLGLADANTVDRLFRDGDLMLCPLNNDFGMKFKVAEAVSYGTPLIASRQTALCVPYLRNILPSFSLSDIPAAAKAIVDLAESEKALIDLSDRIARASAEFITSQGNIWSETLGGILSRHSKAIGRPGSCHKCEVDP